MNWLPRLHGRTYARPLLLVFCLAALLPGGRAWMANKPSPITGDRETGARLGALSPPPPGPSGRSPEALGRQYLFGDSPTASSWFNQARTYLSRGEIEQAIWALRKANRLRPLWAQSHFLLGVAYVRRLDQGLPGDGTDWLALAIKETETATQLDDYLPAWYNLGHLHLRSGKPEAARQAWEHILLISPRSSLGQRASRSLSRLNEACTLPDALTEQWP